MKKIALFTVLTVLVFACSKIIPGFLSPTLGYTDKTIVCKRGLPFIQSQKVNFDGSTSPIKFKLLELRGDGGGKLPPEFTDSFDVLQFKAGMVFDPAVDTTVELLNKKRETKKLVPYLFNTATGQFSFNTASGHLPIGSYGFDISATNLHGSMTIKNAGTIKVSDPTSDDLFLINGASASSGFDDITGLATAAKAPILAFQKVSTDGNRVILKYVDKFGTPFNPAAGQIIVRGGRPSFTNYAKFHPIIYTDTAMICDFEVAPFPLTHYKDATTDWGFLMYYRIPSQFVAIDGFPPTGFSANPYVNFQIKLGGTYVVTVKLSDATHR